MNPNSETIELRTNKNLIRGSGQQQSKLYLTVNTSVDYESVEWNILLLVCFYNDNKDDKAKFLYPILSSEEHHSFYFMYIILFFFIFSFFFCWQNSSFICCKAESPKTSATVKR